MSDILNSIEMEIEVALDLASKPLYNELEVGFRHTPLTNQEKLDRYSTACMFIHQNLEQALKMIRNYKEGVSNED